MGSVDRWNPYVEEWPMVVMQLNAIYATERRIVHFMMPAFGQWSILESILEKEKEIKRGKVFSMQGKSTHDLTSGASAGVIP